MMVTAEHEEHLLELARSGDAEAFQQLYAPHEQWLHRAAYRIVGNAEDAADAVQDALFRIHCNLRRFRGECRFATWLHRVVVNCSLDLVRRRKTRREILAAALGEPWFSDGQPSALEQLDQAETRRSVNQALGHLPGPYRTVVVLRDLHGYSTEEAAGLLGLPVGTVKSRLHRARQLLREEMLA